MVDFHEDKSNRLQRYLCCFPCCCNFSDWKEAVKERKTGMCWLLSILIFESLYFIGYLSLFLINNKKNLHIAEYTTEFEVYIICLVLVFMLSCFYLLYGSVSANQSANSSYRFEIMRLESSLPCAA